MDNDINRIAIVGMAARLPGAANVQEFWDNLRAGRSGIREFTAEELSENGVSSEESSREGYVAAKGFLDGADQFDASFFGYSPREADVLDPQQRIFLECAWEALEDAGCVPDSFEGRIGVFGASSLNTYLISNVLGNPQLVDTFGRYQVLQGSDKDFLATRAAYKFGLTGPAVTVQTACSSALTAVHLACQSLLSGECDMAIAGAASVSAPLKSGYQYERGSITSPDGHCRVFDKDAEGTVPGNGVAIVVLRRAEDAREDHDRVRATILGSAINNDGDLKVGYTAPSVHGQQSVIEEALAMAGVDPETVGYVEAHGTGTSMGDPIEVAALTQAFRSYTDAESFCALGSVKSNIGHLDAAAGAAGLVKTILMLEHGELVPTIDFHAPNPELQLESSPFVIADELSAWEQGDTPRRAGVSSFGIGGTNVHLVLEEAPAEQPPSPSEGPFVLTISGKHRDAVADQAARLADHLEGQPSLDLGRVCDTLHRNRTTFPLRAAVAATDSEDAVRRLRGVNASSVRQARSDVRLAFVFPGQGAQYIGMGRELYGRIPEFAKHIDACAKEFDQHLDFDLKALVFGDAKDSSSEQLARTEITQPALFLIEYALARLLQDWGLEPTWMVGHSIGEYVAACLAGVFTLADATRLVSARGRFVGSMPTGSMLSVQLSEDEVRPWATGDVEIAAVNSSEFCSLSGPSDAIESLAHRLRDEGIVCAELRTSHGFHSASMDGAVPQLIDVARTVSLQAPTMPFFSNVTGQPITVEQATDPEYWGSHLRSTVRFEQAIGTLLDDPTTVFVEVGPGRSMSTLIRAHERWSDERMTTQVLPQAKRVGTDLLQIKTALADLWSAGTPMQSDVLVPSTGGQPLTLPTYAFQHQTHWVHPDITERPTAQSASRDVTLLAPVWLRSLPETRSGDDQHWLLLSQDDAVTAKLQPLLPEGTLVAVPPERGDWADLLMQVEVDEAPVCVVDATAVGVNGSGRSTFEHLMALGEHLASAPLPAGSSLSILTRSVFDVTGEEKIHPDQAMLTGLSAVLGQEINDFSARIVDLGSNDLSASARRVLGKCLVSHETEDMAIRGNHAWLRQFQPITEEPVGQSRLKSNGVYVLTGGLGGVGGNLARHIATSTEQSHLVLLQRSPLPEREEWDAHVSHHAHGDATSERIKKVRELEALGANVTVYSVDVTDEVEMRRVIDDVVIKIGTPDGVIHAAGEPGIGMIAGKTADEIDRVLKPKVDGARVLMQALEGHDVGFVLLCSSVNGILGGIGQSDYASANAFLDAFAVAQQRLGRPVTSVDWSRWEGVGMAAGSLTGQPTESVGHPLLRRVSSSPERQVFACTLTTEDSWIVDDHRLLGSGLVPGTAYIELVRAAVEDRRGDRVLSLSDMLFLSPLFVPDGQERDLTILIEGPDDNLRFSVRSRDEDGWNDNAMGTVRFLDVEPPAPQDVDQVRREHPIREEFHGEDEVFQRAQADQWTEGPLQFAIGPRWHVMRRLELAEGHTLATLALDEEFADDVNDYPLHPALLDIAVGAFRLDAKDPNYLPLSYGELRYYRPLTSEIMVHTRPWPVSDDEVAQKLGTDLGDPRSRRQRPSRGGWLHRAASQRHRCFVRTSGRGI